MISAPNRRRLLSGSNIWMVLCCLLLIGACASQNRTGAPKGYEVIDTKTTPSKPPKSPKDTIPPTDKPKDKDKVGKIEHKPYYNVALVLPFYLDSFPTANGSIYAPSRIGAEYYKGVLSALDTLKQSGLSVKLHVFDSYPETYLDVLIKSGKLKSMDLIIGPVFNSSMKLMAKYATEIGVPVWSPFSPADDITSQNPYFFMANPRMETHAQNMIQFAIRSAKDANLLVLYQNNDQEKKYLETYRKYIQAHNQALDATLADSLKKNSLYKPAKLKLNEKLIENYGSGIPKVSTPELRNLLVDGERNIILVPGMKIPFLVNLLRELFPLSASHDVTLVGTSVLGNDIDLQVDYLNALNAHFIQAYYIKPGFFESSFYLSYLERFKTEPSEYAVNGYDQMFFLGNMLKQFGTGYSTSLDKVVFEGWGTGFSMRPVQPTVADPTKKHAIEYWDNEHVYILRYNDFVLEKVW